ncbi:YezD family protein [Ferriphaselus sp. R-1]|uniref:YezD family protein n=1 Tax=Ferriphaselus sp. R-1 TaxID=1485544 RepID=UPI0009DDA693|nr:YezD family protein [Ferriphaselus sp. R-1]
MTSNTSQETRLLALREIERALGEIQFGSLEITLHEGRVTQIERRERTRLIPDRPIAQVKAR